MAQLISKKFTDLLKAAVESSEYIAEQLVISISKGQKKDAWKGLILGELHSAYKIKQTVQRIM